MTQASVMPAFRYYAFISYSHQDQAWADWLHKALETYAIPKRLVGQSTAAGVIPKRLTPIFRDRDELASANDLGRKVNEALAQSANLIVICSPRSAASRWVDEEVLAFKRLGHSERIFCLIVDGEPNATELPGRAAEECFAHALRYQLGADDALSSERTEPIAADARPGKDGKTNAKLKLIAGMLEVGFDQLKQRELQRRTRRMTAIAALAVAVMAVTTTLAIAALFARHAAVVASHAAERRQKQAEGLVTFMLGDLNDKLAQVSRLDIMEAVDDRAMEYFESLPTTDVTPESLAQRAKALEKIGSIRLNQGHLPAAMMSFQSALKLAVAIGRASPEDTAKQLFHAEIWAYIGMTHWYGGHLDAAQQSFESAQTILKRAQSHAPNDLQLLNQLAQIDNNIGHVLEARGDLAAAKVQYIAVQKLYENLRTREPANSLWQSSLGDAYDNLGKLAIEQGQLTQGIAAYLANQRIKAAFFARDPNNHDGQESLLVSNAILGRALAMCGEDAAALHYVRDAVDSARALIKFDPANAYWQEDFAYYSHALGDLLRQHGQFDEAAAADADAIRVFGKLVAKDSTNIRWRRELAQSQLENARLHLAQGDVDAAHSSAQFALATIEQLRATNADDRNLILIAAQAYTALGQIAARRNDAAAAHDYWRQARDAVAPAAQVGENPNFLAVYAGALLLLDEVDAARPFVEKLWSMGYRTKDFVVLLSSRQLAYQVNEEFSRRIADAMQ